MASHCTSLIPSKALPEQERIFARAFALLKQAVQERVFPGASLAVVYRGELAAWRGVGRFTYAPDSPPVTPTTVFDLASVTKVVATTAMAMILYERGLLSLDEPSSTCCRSSASREGSPSPDPRRRHVTIRMLLAHSSGLADYESFSFAPAPVTNSLRLACHRAACRAADAAAPVTATSVLLCSANCLPASRANRSTASAIAKSLFRFA